jgi:AraC-like DNA-binding protein
MTGAAPSRSVPPRPRRDPVVVVCAGPQQRVRLIDSLKRRAQLRLVDSVTELAAHLQATAESIDVVVIGVESSETGRAARVIRGIAQTRPTVAIVAYCRIGSQYSADIRALALAGVHQFLFGGVDDTGVALRAVLDAARGHRDGERVMERLAALIPPGLQPAVEAILARPDEIITIDGLAEALGIRRRTLFLRCTRDAFLPAGELLIWVRLALVAHLLETTGCTVEAIARQLRYPSDTALRNTIKRHTGRRAHDLRGGHGLDCVLSALGERIRRARNGLALSVTQSA